MHVGYSTQGRKDLRTWRLTLGFCITQKEASKELNTVHRSIGHVPRINGKRAEPSTKEISAIQLLSKDLLNTDFSAHIRQVIQTLGSVQERSKSSRGSGTSRSSNKP